jgi:hypothetical protein
VNRCRVGKGCRDRLPITPCKGWADPSDGTASMFEQGELRGGEPILFPEKRTRACFLSFLSFLSFVSFLSLEPFLSFVSFLSFRGNPGLRYRFGGRLQIESKGSPSQTKKVGLFAILCEDRLRVGADRPAWSQMWTASNYRPLVI